LDEGHFCKFSGEEFTLIYRLLGRWRVKVVGDDDRCDDRNLVAGLEEFLLLLPFARVLYFRDRLEMGALVT